MIDRLLGRGRGSGDPRPERFPAGASCGAAGCSNTSGYRCSYVDSTGARCGWWCQTHAVFMDGKPWCRRHATVVKWLKARKGERGEIFYEAAIGDRSPNLVAFIVDLLNPEVTEYLQISFAMHPKATVIIDDQVRPATIASSDLSAAEEAAAGTAGRQSAWESGWGVSSDVGYLARVVLRATATEPPVVHLYVNGTHALARTPDWIANRGRATDNAEDRRAFGQAVMKSVRSALGGMI